ncbi:thiamine biosynthesis lipoprotein [Streptococcus pneumoniae]|nr:thiamine biosynthesis lipoprotein [Streptococcus pneumoniae]
MTLRSHSERLMGTTITISLVDEQADIFLQKSFDLLKELEYRFNANSQESELMEINYQAGIAPVTVHPDLFELISLGLEHSLALSSHLNISIGPLIQTWRIVFSDAKVAQPQEIESVLPLINPHNIELDSSTSTVFLKQKGMKIDLGCLAKGYSADKVAQFLRKEGVTSALINLGGNILTIGKNQARGDNPWQIGIQDPANPRGNHLMTIPVVNKSVVTSGIYERHLTVDGQDYHHIFDSQTGYPVETELASLTIISDKSVDGEIWTTRLFGERPASILWQVESLEGIEIILIDKEGHLSCSSGIPTL